MSSQSMSQYLVLQIATTRFAVRCDYLPFMKWLTEKCSGFISRGEPDLRLNLMLNQAVQDDNSDDILAVEVVGDRDNHRDLDFKVVCSYRPTVFRFILQVCLRRAIAENQSRDLLLHSSCIVHEGMAYIFTGVSGSGKSTVCDLLEGDPSFTILHDEAVVISQAEDGFRAYSTPLNGERPGERNISAPLRAIFFLKQDSVNYATKLSGSNATAQIISSVLPLYNTAHGCKKLGPLALSLAEHVPCYELHFRKEPGFWECIPPLFKNESVPTLERV